MNSFYDWDWAAGERHFRTAIELDPYLGIAQAWFAHALSARGRRSESLAVITKALDSEPASPAVDVVVVQTLLQLGLYKEAIEACKKALDFDCNSAIVLWALGLAYVLAGTLEQGIASLRRSIAHMPEPKVPVTPVLTWLGYAYALAGDKQRAGQIVMKLQQSKGRQYVSPCDFALIHFGLGQKDEGFQKLEEAWQDRSFWLGFFAPLTFRLANAETDPRAIDLLHRMDLC